MRLAIIVSLLAGGCLKTTAFSCEVPADCTRGTEQGACESTGFCSFVDGTCPEGRRYGELSGPFAGQCVGGPTPDAGEPDAPAAPFCDSVGEPTLVGCWELEGNLDDASGDANNGVGTAITFAPGKTGLAAQLMLGSNIAVADSASLTSPSISIEAWINPAAVPGVGTRQGIFDNQNQYGLFLVDGGLQCINVNAVIAIAPNAFTHIACTYDGATGRLYVNGTEVAMMGGGGPLGSGDDTGSTIAGNSPGPSDTLVGLIDQLRVWNVARTPQQICNAAGQPNCP